MTTIIVPKTPKKAYNPGRPASGLLRSQMEHLAAACGDYASPYINPYARKKRRKPVTEGEAAEYIRTMTEQLRTRGPAPEPQAAAAAPVMPKPAKKKKRKAASRKRRTRRGAR